jgi:hypothetical protein
MDPIKLVSVIAAALTRVTFGTLTAPFAFFSFVSIGAVPSSRMPVVRG